MQIDLKYRPDIDGLRAIAVSLVLLFHFGLGFTGGYVGVDVFFVISGYLITGIIIRDLNKGKFSLKDFWVRRIRRIVPAATAMVTAVLIAGYFLHFPDDYKELGFSAIWQQAMASNFFFWRNTGYFAGNGDIKPLLHTWSLSVEEQFYLGYPLFLASLFRFGKRAITSTIIAIATASFLLSLYSLKPFPAATFYLLPTRAWELLAGAAIWTLPTPSILFGWVKDYLSVTSIAGILICSWMLTDESPFPGFHAVTPCLSTMVWIYINSYKPSRIAAYISTPPFVGIGLISYSLYLWHWPILTFYQYWQDGEIPLLIKLILITVSFATSYLSWKFIELPFRGKSPTKQSAKTFTFAVAVFIVLISVSTIVAIDGLKWRVTDKVNQYLQAKHSSAFTVSTTIEKSLREDYPILGMNKGEISCVLWGDSHAMALAPGLDAALKEHNKSGRLITYSSTPPILEFINFSRWGLNTQSPYFNELAVDSIRNRKIPIVFLSCIWSDHQDKPDFEEKIRLTVNKVTEFGATVYLILDVAHQERDVPRTHAKLAFWSVPDSNVGVADAFHRERNRMAEAIINQICRENPKAIAIDPAEYFLTPNRYWRTKNESGELLYRDEHHLSVDGGLRLEPMFSRVLNQGDAGTTEQQID